MAHPFKCTAVSILAVIAAQGALAQTAIELDEITAFATLAPTPINRTGATVEIVTEEELRLEGTTQLSDFLRRRAGISATSNGGLGAATNLRIRGLNSQYVAVRIDGIDITDPSVPQTFFDFGKLTTADVSRIEIVKGSQSALFGTSAVAGAIDITTRRAESPGTTVSVDVEGGSYDTIRGAVNVATLGERGETSLTFSRVVTEGFSAADENDGNIEPDGYQASRVSFFGAFDATDSFRVGLNGFYEENGLEFDSGFGPVDGPQFENGTTRGLRAFAEYSGEIVDHTFSIQTFENERIGDFGGFPYDYTGERQKIDYLGTMALLGEGTLSFGAQYTDESFASTSEGASGDRQTTAVFAEALFAVTPDFDLSAALRYDDFSDFGDFVSGRLAAAYRLGSGTTLRAVVSNGFRAPSLYELNAPFIGNPGLEAEESLNFEFGVEQEFANGGRVQATVFRTEIENLIQFAGFGYDQVPGTSDTQGIEISGSMPIGSTAELFGNYTYTDATAADGSRLLRVPRNDLTLGIAGSITDRIDGLFTAQFISGLDDITGPLDDYVVANATITYAVTDAAEAYFRVENIFNEEYQNVAGYGTSDRAFYVGLRASF